MKKSALHNPIFLASLLALAASFMGCNIGQGSETGGTKALTTSGHLALARYQAPESACTAEFKSALPGASAENDPLDADKLWSIDIIRRLQNTNRADSGGKLMASRGTEGSNANFIDEDFKTHPHLAALVKHQLGVRYDLEDGDRFFENKKAAFGGLNLSEDQASADYKLGNIILLLAESLRLVEVECDKGRGCIWKDPSNTSSAAYQIIHSSARANNAPTDEDIADGDLKRTIVDETNRTAINELLGKMGYTNVSFYTDEQALQIAAATAMGLVHVSRADQTVDLQAKPDNQTVVATLSNISLPDCSVHQPISGAAVVELGGSPSNVSSGTQPTIYNAFTVGAPRDVNPFATSSTPSTDDTSDGTDDGTDDGTET